MAKKNAGATAPKAGAKVTPITAKRAASTVAAEAPKPRAPRPRDFKGHIPPDATIRVLVAENPKRPNTATHERFKLYRTGMTVAEALHKGITKLDLRWDAGEGRNFIEFVAAKPGKAKKAAKEASAE